MFRCEVKRAETAIVAALSRRERRWAAAIHRPLEIAADTSAFGGNRMRSLVLVIAVALACSGCMATSTKPAISGAKAGDGNIKRTQFIEI